MSFQQHITVDNILKVVLAIAVGVLLYTIFFKKTEGYYNYRAIDKLVGDHAYPMDYEDDVDDDSGIPYTEPTDYEDDVMEAAIEAGAEDAESDAESHVITTAFEDMNAVLEGLEARFGPAKSTSIIWKPKSSTPVAGDDVATLFKLIDALDDDDDVQNVYGNYDMSDEDLAKYAG